MEETLAEVLNHRGYTGESPFVYPIFHPFTPGEAKQLCAEVHNSLHTLRSWEGSMRLITLTILRLEPRAPSAGTEHHTGHELRYTGHVAGWCIPRGVQGCIYQEGCIPSIPTREAYTGLYTLLPYPPGRHILGYIPLPYPPGRPIPGLYTPPTYPPGRHIPGYVPSHTHQERHIPGIYTRYTPREATLLYVHPSCTREACWVYYSLLS